MQSKPKAYYYAEIYLITSPSGKQYVGKANCYTSAGLLHGTKGRWGGHITDSKAQNGGNCRLLNEEIRLYGKDAFVVTAIATCPLSLVDDYEQYFIADFNTSGLSSGLITMFSRSFTSSGSHTNKCWIPLCCNTLAGFGTIRALS